MASDKRDSTNSSSHIADVAAAAFSTAMVVCSTTNRKEGGEYTTKLCADIQFIYLQ